MIETITRIYRGLGPLPALWLLLVWLSYLLLRKPGPSTATLGDNLFGDPSIR